MPDLSINTIINDEELSARIFHHLNDEDIPNCALVNKTWYHATNATRNQRTLKITPELVHELKTEKKSLSQLILDKYKYMSDLYIRGWSQGKTIPEEIYESLLNSKLTAKKLILFGRGSWVKCYCPKKKSKCGEQFDSSNGKSTVNLRYILIGTTFKISSCALLDLISRCPNLEVLKFQGKLSLDDHTGPFNTKRFLSDLKTLHWPWPIKQDLPTLSLIIKRNENITNFFSNAHTTCDILASDSLTKLKYLSLNLNENWVFKPGKHQKGCKYTDKLRYLSMAKEVEALEIRTYEFLQSEDDDDSNDNIDKVRLMYENYQFKFWEQVGKLPVLRYLAIYGSWEFEKVCREMSKQGLQIEFLKLNLMPQSVISAIEAEDDCPTLSMADGLRKLRELPTVRSLQYNCYEKMGTVDKETVAVMKELKDIFWKIEIKTAFTEEIEDLFNSVMRRANQLGKTYKLFLVNQIKNDKFAHVVTVHDLKFPIGTELKTKLTEIAEAEIHRRLGKPCFDTFYTWGFELTKFTKNEALFERISSGWKHYGDQFPTDLEFP